jgi:prepilin-type processing-associated H-X9-DG protein
MKMENQVVTMQQNDGRNRRRAFTVIELVVTLGVIGLLLSLLLPAVQYARESARRLSCRNNLHQLGVAIETHATVVEHYPDAEIAFRELLANIDQAEILRNITKGLYEDGSLPRPTVPAFLCPSDPLMPVPDRLNYAANVGTGYLAEGLNGFFTTESSLFVPVISGQSGSSRLTRPRDITDGLSQTIAVAEMLPSSTEGMHPAPSPISDVRRIDWVVDPALTSAGQFRELVETCGAIKSDPATGVRTGTTRGWNWANSVRNFGLATYHHALSPNMPSCLNAGHQYAVFSAGSLHARGSNVLYGDGHVDFVSDNIDDKLWKNLGTRAGESSE